MIRMRSAMRWRRRAQAATITLLRLDQPTTSAIVALGRVIEIWRYPVKSMGGEQLQRCALGKLGIPGDRGWAVRDEAAGEIRAQRSFRRFCCSVPDTSKSRRPTAYRR